ncbi:MAG: hypothetical protein CMN63_01510 [Sphingobium sp.]|nr:hypothetical protein [Sphingobium sp.]
MAKDKILKQKVHHDGVSMVVLKSGDRYAVPDTLRQSWIDEGVIAGKTSKEIAKEEEAARAAAAEQEDEEEDGDVAPLFTAKHIAGGLFEITGPGLEQPERVKGKAETEARVVALTEAYEAQQAASNGGGGAPI